VGRDGRVQIDDNIVLIPEIQQIAAKKRQDIPNVIMSLRIDEGARMGIVTDIQQQLRKGDALRINYSKERRTTTFGEGTFYAFFKGRCSSALAFFT
jgi:hypothetical protein